jgi:hypothetical protein
MSDKIASRLLYPVPVASTSASRTSQNVTTTEVENPDPVDRIEPGSAGPSVDLQGGMVLAEPTFGVSSIDISDARGLGVAAGLKKPWDPWRRLTSNATLGV